MFLKLFLSQIYEILDQGRDKLYFQVFPGHFYFMRWHSLVELTEHDNSAADNVMVYSIVHNIHRCCCSHTLICT